MTLPCGGKVNQVSPGPEARITNVIHPMMKCGQASRGFVFDMQDFNREENKHFVCSLSCLDWAAFFLINVIYGVVKLLVDHTINITVVCKLWIQEIWSEVFPCKSDIFFLQMQHMASSKFTCCPVWFNSKMCPNWRCNVKWNLTPSVDKYHKYSSLKPQTKEVSFQFNTLFLPLVQSWSEEFYFPRSP